MITRQKDQKLKQYHYCHCVQNMFKEQGRVIKVFRFAQLLNTGETYLNTEKILRLSKYLNTNTKYSEMYLFKYRKYLNTLQHRQTAH